MRIFSILFLVLIMLVGCSKPGSQFEGKWVNVTKKDDKLEIKRNGDGFILITSFFNGFTGKTESHEVPATLTNDTIKVSGFLGTVDFVVDKSSGMLINSSDKYKKEN